MDTTVPWVPRTEHPSQSGRFTEIVVAVAEMDVSVSASEEGVDAMASEDPVEEAVADGREEVGAEDAVTLGEVTFGGVEEGADSPGTVTTTLPAGPAVPGRAELDGAELVLDAEDRTGTVQPPTPNPKTRAAANMPGMRL